VIAPAAILAAWGGSYVWSCVLALSAPGRPVEFRYKATGGSVRLWARSYLVDWSHGLARAEQPRIFGPDGSEVASANYVEATGISLPTPKRIAVTVRDLHGSLGRLKSGGFGFQQLLPEHKGPSTAIPFSVKINRADIDVVDLAGKAPFHLAVIVRDVDVRGFGQEWMANGSIELPGSGSLRAEVQNLPKEGLLVRGTTAGLQVAPLLAHLEEIPDTAKLTFLRDLRANSIEAVGPFSVLINRDAPFRLETHLSATAKDVRFREYGADSASFSGDVSDSGAQGVIEGRTVGVTAKLTGSIVWQPAVQLGGQLQVDASALTSLPSWLRKMIPSQISATDDRFNGWLAFREGSGLNIEGPVVAQQATLYGQQFTQPKVIFTLNPDHVRIGIEGGRWAETPVQGAVVVGLKSRALTGAFSAGAADLGVIGRRFRAEGLSGRADVSVLLGGTSSNPTAILQAVGAGSYRVKGKLITGRFQAAGSYNADRLRIDRFRVGTDSGNARAIGTISLRNKSLYLKVDATSLQLERIRDNLAGNINASGFIQGSLSNPRFNGQALALDVKVSDFEIPFASADISGSRYLVAAKNLRVVRGTGEATGDLALNVQSRGLTGTVSAKNVLLNEYLGQDFLGTVTVPSVTIGGTLEQPRLTGTASGENLVLGGIQVDRADLVGNILGRTATVETLNAKLGQGFLTGTGKYDLRDKFGSFDVRGQDLALSRITPPGKGAANVTGNLNGEADATISPSGTWRGKAGGTLEAVNLNDTEFGSGTWNMAYDGENLTGNASIGKLDRFLLLENVDYDTTRDFINAQVSVLNGSLQDLYTSSRPFFSALSNDVRQKLDTAQGDLDTTVVFSGPIRNPNLDVKFLEARNLELQGQPLGDLRAVFDKIDTTWDIASLNWQGPEGSLMIDKSVIDTSGTLYVDGELSNLDLKYADLIDPSWAGLVGHASASFQATGETRSPVIRASIDGVESPASSPEAANESFSVSLDTVSVSQALYRANGDYTGGISASGKFFFRGFTGDVVAHIPLNYPVEIPDGPPITASLRIPNVDVKDLAPYVTSLDTARSSGKLEGTISVIGPKTKLALSGTVLGDAQTLAFNDVQTTLKATVLSVALKDNQIALTLKADGSAGGLLTANLGATQPDLRSTLDQLARGDTRTISRTPVQGSITTTGFVFRQDSKSKEQGAYHATVNSTLAVSGPAASPTITGRVGISNTNILLPSTFAGSAGSPLLAFNPNFDIPIELEQVARFRTGTADVSLSGGGQLTGTLAKPNFQGTLTVQNGRINLPTARVTLEEGGTMRPSYSVSSTGEASARVDVNLQGNTAVTAMKTVDTVQRYDIRLSITGNLLADGGLNLNATSDPPDLSKDEILALLGQTDVLNNLGSASNTSQSEAESRIRNALVSIAVPQVTQGLTNQLASGLGLEYLSVDYNAIEGTSIDFAKVLGKALVLQGRRQLSPTFINRKIDYDLRLTYRLPSRNVALNRVVFSVGMDQDRPYKLGVEYGFRF